MSSGEPSTARPLVGHVGFAVLLLAGLLIRLPLLPLFGTPDHYGWKIWSYAGATHPLGLIYRMDKDRRPPVTWSNIQKVLDDRLAPASWSYGGREEVIVYPPVVPLALGVVGKAYIAFSPSYQDTPLLNAVLKLPALLADMLATCLIYFAALRRLKPRIAVAAAGAYWLNPMSILGGALLAYQDPIYAAALIAAALLFSGGRHAWGWAFFVVAVLTKPQPALAVPILLAASVAQRRCMKLPGYVASSAASALLVMMPFVLSGTVLNVFSGAYQIAKQPFLSGNNCNIWWLAGYLLQVKQRLAGGDPLDSALRVQTEIALMPDLLAAGRPDPKIWGAVFMLVFTLAVIWAWWRRAGSTIAARSGRSPLVAEGIALQIYGGTMLLTQSHENHAYGAAALLGLAWWLERKGGRPDRELLALYCALSVIVTLNMTIFYGLGGDPPTTQFPRGATLVDASVLLSVVNYLLFGWWLWRWIRDAVPRRKGQLLPAQQLA
ncbi:MAG TPA: hypothetical protein VM409_02885 [Chloroflexia bacterium]|nr:hypothetical protein [Chloroflexia bacterium]